MKEIERALADAGRELWNATKKSGSTDEEQAEEKTVIGAKVEEMTEDPDELAAAFLAKHGDSFGSSRRAIPLPVLEWGALLSRES